MRHIHIIGLLLLLILIVSCKAFQYGTEYPKSSKFSNLNLIGKSKEDFVSEFGAPTSTALKTEKDNVYEKLYYAETLQNVTITTEFTFKSNVLAETKIFHIGDNIQPLIDSLRWEIRQVRISK